jgi:hypothetical protein
MRVRLRSRRLTTNGGVEVNVRELPLSDDQEYEVIGIEDDQYRLLDDNGLPYLYSAASFEVTDSEEPSNWVTEYGEEGERYAYPMELLEPGFFEDFFDGKPDVVQKFRSLYPGKR